LPFPFTIASQVDKTAARLSKELSSKPLFVDEIER
jgi:hypothetical protein